MTLTVRKVLDGAIYISDIMQHTVRCQIRGKGGKWEMQRGGNHGNGEAEIMVMERERGSRYTAKSAQGSMTKSISRPISSVAKPPTFPARPTHSLIMCDANERT